MHCSFGIYRSRKYDPKYVNESFTIACNLKLLVCSLNLQKFARAMLYAYSVASLYLLMMTVNQIATAQNSLPMEMLYELNRKRVLPDAVSPLWLETQQAV